MYHNPVSLPVKNCLRPPIKTLTNSGGSAKSKKKIVSFINVFSNLSLFVTLAFDMYFPGEILAWGTLNKSTEYSKLYNAEVSATTNFKVIQVPQTARLAVCRAKTEAHGKTSQYVKIWIPGELDIRQTALLATENRTLLWDHAANWKYFVNPKSKNCCWIQKRASLSNYTLPQGTRTKQS